PNINAAFTLREAFDLFLKEYNLTLFNDTAYYAFALDVLNGKVDSRVSYAYLTEFKQVKDATPLTYNDDIYNFGVKVRSLAFASSVVPAGSYKEIKIEQEGDANVETLVYFDSGNGLELRGSASKGKPLIIAADDYRANTKSIVLVTKKTQHEDNTKSYPSRLTISVGDPEPVLAIGEQQLGFGSDGGEKEVVVTTNVASLSISAPSWITAHFDGANNKLTVKAARNDNTQERSDSIIVRAENSIGRVTSTIKVSQDGKDEAKEREKLWEGVSFTDFSTDGSIIFTSSPSGRMDSRIPISNIMTSAAGDVITVTGSAENISSYENSSLETESITIQVSIDKKKEVMSATIVRKETTESRWQQTRHLYEYVTEVTVDSVPLSSAREYHPDPYWTDESHRPAKITSAIDARLDKKHVTACHYTKKETYWQLPANYWEEPSWEITGTLSSVSQDVEWNLGDVKHINDFVIRLLEPATAADAPQ
ncbi:MAG: BACON domain-containing protein, partial [Prevotella sp.]|nr:BACON domain-containing protein [Prevotella sp.]